MTVAELWRSGQAGWPPNYPLAQFPNAPLLAALAGSGIAATAGGEAHDVGRALFFVGLGVWAWQELADGVNLFRRVLGASFLVWILATLAGEL